MGSNASLQVSEGFLRIEAFDPPFTYTLAIIVTANMGKENERTVSLRCRKLDEAWELYTPGEDEEPVAVEMQLSFPEATFAKLEEGIGIALHDLAVAGAAKEVVPTHESLQDSAYRRRHYQHCEHMRDH